MNEELNEKLARYTRFLDNEDARNTLKEVDAFFNLDEISLGLFSSSLAVDPRTGQSVLSYKPHAEKQLLLKEGARSYSMVLRALVEKTREQIEQQNKQKEGETYG